MIGIVALLSKSSVAATTPKGAWGSGDFRYRAADAMQHERSEMLLRRAGAHRYQEPAAKWVPVLQRVTFVPRRARDTINQCAGMADA
jgi:hypothetical protein